MKRIVLIAFFVVALGISTSAQYESGSTAATPYYEADFTYNKDAVKERQVIEPCYVREADIKYSRRIHRIIDVRQKLNHVLTWERNPFARVLWENVLNNNLRAFKNDSLSDKTFYTAEDIMGMGGAEEVVQIPGPFYPEDPDDIKDTVILKVFDYKSIIKYRIMEDWIFDYQRSVFEPRIIAIAPYYKPIFSGVESEFDVIFFWIKMDQFRQVLANAELFNRHNDAARLTYDDFFQLRLFDSYVIKESNDRDWDINQFPEFKDDGISALLEAENVKNDLFIFEHDLWEY